MISLKKATRKTQEKRKKKNFFYYWGLNAVGIMTVRRTAGKTSRCCGTVRGMISARCIGRPGRSFGGVVVTTGTSCGSGYSLCARGIRSAWYRVGRGRVITVFPGFLGVGVGILLFSSSRAIRSVQHDVMSRGLFVNNNNNNNQNQNLIN